MDDDPEELQFENVVDPRLAILIVWVIFFCIFIILPSFCIRCLGCCIVVNDNPNDGYGYTTEARILRFGEGNREDREAGMELAYRTLERYNTLSSASKKEVDVMRGGVLRRYLKRCSMMCSLEERSEMMEVEKRKMEAGDADADADAALVTIGSTSDELSLEDANNNDDPDVYIHCLSISESDEVHNDEEAARPSSSSSSSQSQLMANTDDDIHHSIKPSEASSSAVEQQQQHQQQQQQQYPTMEKNENEEHTHTHVRIPFPGYYRDGTKIEEKEPSVADSDDDNEDDVNDDDDEGDNEASNNNSNWRFSLSSFFRAQVQAAADAETGETTVTTNTTTTTNTTPIEGNDASTSALSNENNNELRHDATATNNNNNKNNAIPPPSPNPKKEHDDERPPMPTTTTMITRNVPAFCAICLGEYEHSDIISWSSNPKCTHVFHQECIVTWLTALGRRKGFKYYANGDDDRRRRGGRGGGQRGGRQGQQQQQQRSHRDNSTEEDRENGLYLLNYDLECPCCRQDFILTENVVVLEEGEEEVGIVGSSGGLVETVNCDNGRGDENV